MNRTDLVRSLVGAFGVVAAPPLLALQRKRNLAPILLYHRVALGRDAAYPPIAPATLVEHCEFVARHFRVLPLRELTERALSGKSIGGSCAICFDDGYLDFREHAVPILRRFGFPVTHFLVADCVESGLPPWTYRLNRIANALTWTASVHKDHGKRLGGLTASEREAWLTSEAQSAPDLPPLPKMLRADDVRAIDLDGLEWGAHTSSHGYLDRVAGAEVEREIRTSKARIEAATGRPVKYLAYPDGFFDARAQKAAEASGFEAAFTVQQDALKRTSPRFAVPRYDVTDHPTRLFKIEVTGFVESMRRLRAQ